jgi:phosphohistidine phosphatase
MPSKRLVLLRHAKSSWADLDVADHERPLTSRGRSAAASIGRHLHHRGVRPDLVLCSSAIRARQTLELVGLFPHAEIRFEDRVYAAGAGDLFALLREVAATVDCVLLIGHNPGIEELATLLVKNAQAWTEKFPTAAMADIRLPIRNWEALAKGVGDVQEFVVPRQLRSHRG